MEVSNIDWSHIRLRVNIQAPAEKVYRAWATKEGLESWFLRDTKFTDPNGKIKGDAELLTKGDSYVWYWHGHPDADHQGKILDSNGKDSFSFSFSFNCPVMVSIYKEQEETIVELVESNIPTENGPVFKHYMSNTTGWLFYLVNLKSILEGGKDLRNRNMSLKNVITA